MVEVDHGKIYRVLSKRYGWSPAVIAELTIDQQLMYAVNDDEENNVTLHPKTGRPMISFNNEREYQEYLKGK
jgi:hypothetical protein